MKDMYGVELLKEKFSGEGNMRNLQFKQLMRNINKCFYSVSDEWYNFHFEIILPYIKIGPILKYPYEIYPSDKYLNSMKWRFEEYNEALNFYDNLEV